MQITIELPEDIVVRLESRWKGPRNSSGAANKCFHDALSGRCVIG